MWHPSHPAAEQCEGCTWVTTQVTDLDSDTNPIVVHADILRPKFFDYLR